MDIAVLLSHTYMTVMPQSNVQKRLLYLVSLQGHGLEAY